jgi:general secretion pathway protein I
LLEVLIAMTILAVAAGGLLAASGNSLRQMQALEKRSLGGWIAENQMTELRAARAWPELGVKDAAVSMAGREWHVRVSVTQTPAADMRQYVVEVFDDSGASPVAALTGFMGRH